MATKVKLIADGVITPDQITLTTASTGTNTTAPATTAFVQQEISALVDSSPDALNTLNELAAALGDDANFSTTVTNSIALKAPLASPTFTGDLTVDTDTFYVDSTNNRVGIGTTSPQKALNVFADNTAPVRFERNTSDGQIIQLYKDGTTVGSIGTASSGNIFYQGGGSKAGLEFGSTAIIPFNNGVRADATNDLGGSSNRFKDLYLSGTLTNDGTGGISIDTSGNVGIGASPVAGLHVQTSTRSLSLAPSATGGGGGSYILMGNSDSGGVTGPNVIYSGNRSLLFGVGDNFSSATGGTFSEYMRIDSSGNVGIGTTSPDQPLHVVGTRPLRLQRSGVGEFEISIDNTISGDSSDFVIEPVSGSNSAGFQVRTRDTAGSLIEALNVNHDGNVGIGTDSPAVKLDVNAGAENVAAKFTSTDAGSYIQFMDNNASGHYLGTNGNRFYILNTSNVERFQIDSNGTVLVGLPSRVWSGANFEVVNNARVGNIYLTGQSSDSTISSGNGSFKFSTLTATGGGTGLDFDVNIVVSGVGIANRFKVDSPTGDTYTNDGTISSLSDIRVKTDINDLTDGLEIVKQLRPVTFKYNDNSTDEDGNGMLAAADDKIRYGFIAQEVEEVAPHYVETSTRKISNEEVDDFKSLSTTRMIPMLFKAIQEQQTIIEDLKARIETLENA